MGVRLDQYNNDTYQPGSIIKRTLWWYCSLIIFESGWFPFSRLKCIFLRLFGAKVGAGVIIKPHVKIKYPWLLEIGAHTWIGEKVWIDNLAQVTIGAHVCISQSAYLLCGSHNYKKSNFPLITLPIVIEDGAWICAQSTVGPGVKVKKNAVLSMKSLATKNLDAHGIYFGVPSVKIKEREIRAYEN